MKLIQMTTGKWILISDQDLVFGTLDEIRDLAVTKLGILPADFDYAVRNFGRSKTNVAHFGVFGTLLFTEQYNFKDGYAV